MSGVDAVWLCQEHTGSTLNDIENQIRAAKLYDVDAIVRVQRGSYSDLVRPLELDASGIMVPHVMSAQEARDIARWTRFAPVGRRPIDGGNADGAYCQIPGLEYMQSANAERLVMIQLEDPEPFEELDEIASVEGIDMLFFGPSDYAHGIGVPMQFDHPKVNEARRKVAEVAVRHGKFAGTPGTPENLNELIDMGYRFINIGADVLILAEGFKRIAETFVKAKTPPAPASACKNCSGCNGK
jgi:4-hydroxy-2-oxoheptanedioate aldolase